VLLDSLLPNLHLYVEIIFDTLSGSEHSQKWRKSLYWKVRWMSAGVRENVREKIRRNGRLIDWVGSEFEYAYLAFDCVDVRPSRRRDDYSTL
jgi:hypothetical protein